MVDLPSVYMVDLPGYGYAKVPQGMKSAWDELATRYFQDNRDLKLLMVLIDIRRDPESEEYLIVDLAKKSSITPVILATKVDKLSHSARIKRLKEIREASGMVPIEVSSMTKLGMDSLWNMIIAQISG
jgi:GTP-binding protein